MSDVGEWGNSGLNGVLQELEPVLRRKTLRNPSVVEIVDSEEAVRELFKVFLGVHFWTAPPVEGGVSIADKYYELAHPILEKYGYLSCEKLKHDLLGVFYFFERKGPIGVGDHRRYLNTRSLRDKDFFSVSSILGFLEWLRHGDHLNSLIQAEHGDDDGSVFDSLFYSLGKMTATFERRLPRWDLLEAFNEWRWHFGKQPFEPRRLYLEEKTYSGPMEAFNRIVWGKSERKLLCPLNIHIQKEIEFCGIVASKVMFSVCQYHKKMFLFELETAMCDWQKKK